MKKMQCLYRFISVWVVLLLCAGIAILAVGCGGSVETLQDVYEAAVAEGYEGTYEEFAALFEGGSAYEIACRHVGIFHRVRILALWDHFRPDASDPFFIQPVYRPRPEDAGQGSPLVTVSDLTRGELSVQYFIHAAD